MMKWGELRTYRHASVEEPLVRLKLYCHLTISHDTARNVKHFVHYMYNSKYTYICRYSRYHYFYE